MTDLHHLLAAATSRLGKTAIDNPALDARLLIGHALRLDRNAMMAASEHGVSDADAARIDALIGRREHYEPVARIIGSREFWSLDFGLNEATLEPRPDSETLVETALKNLRGKTAPRLLDLGTGTGCLLLSLLHEIPDATGIGIDKAPRAVEQAQINATNLRLSSRAVFRQGDWLDGITEKFDAVMSNPPYIPASVIPTLMPDVRKHDPMLALDGGADGLAAYRLLIPQVPAILKPQGCLILEIGIDQANPVRALCRQAGLTGISTHKDLNGIERCVVGFGA